MLAIARDLSVAFSADDNDENLDDRFRDAFAADASSVEDVRVLSATAYPQPPAAAIERLDARRGQKNLMIRVILRDLDKTLTNHAANDLCDGRTSVPDDLANARSASARDLTGLLEQPSEVARFGRRERLGSTHRDRSVA